MKNPVRDMPPSLGEDPKGDTEGRRSLRDLKKEVAIKEQWLIDAFDGKQELLTCETYLWNDLDYTNDLMEKKMAVHEQDRVVVGGYFQTWKEWIVIDSSRDLGRPKYGGKGQGFRLVRTKK